MKIIKEKASMQDRKECDRNLKGTRVYVLGKCSIKKQTEKGNSASPIGPSV